MPQQAYLCACFTTGSYLSHSHTFEIIGFWHELPQRKSFTKASNAKEVGHKPEHTMQMRQKSLDEIRFGNTEWSTHV